MPSFPDALLRPSTILGSASPPTGGGQEATASKVYIASMVPRIYRQNATGKPTSPAPSADRHGVGASGVMSISYSNQDFDDKQAKAQARCIALGHTHVGYCAESISAQEPADEGVNFDAETPDALRTFAARHTDGALAWEVFPSRAAGEATQAVKMLAEIALLLARGQERRADTIIARLPHWARW